MYDKKNHFVRNIVIFLLIVGFGWLLINYINYQNSVNSSNFQACALRELSGNYPDEDCD